MAKMKTVMLFTEWKEPLSILNLEQKGRLLDALLNYPDNGTPDFDDPLLSMAWAFMDRALSENKQRYDDICEKRREAGRRGAEITNSRSQQMAANADKCQQDAASAAKSKSKSKSKSEDTNVSIIEANASAPKKFVPPSVDECTAYFREKGCPLVEGEKFFDYFNSNGRKVSGKAAMKNWQSAANNWMRRYEEAHPQERGESSLNGQFAGI